MALSATGIAAAVAMMTVVVVVMRVAALIATVMDRRDQRSHLIRVTQRHQTASI